MATKKSAPAKKAAPVKKQSKPAVAAKKAAPKPKSSAGGKAVTVKAASKPVRPSGKAPVKAAPKKTARPSGKTAPVKAKAVKAAPAAAGKPVAAKTAAAPPKKKAAKTVQKAPPAAPVKAGKKAAAKVAPPKKEQSLKPPVVPKLSTKSAVKYQPDFTKSILDTPKNEHVKPVVRYSDSDLQEFKEIILRKLDAAKKELTYLQGLITRRDEGGDMDEGRYMTMEDGSVSMEREQLSQLASRQITFIDHLEKALMRVENKTYGICRVTGNLIDKARLRAVPHATLSMEAKTTMNK
ncbi:MAG TPA: TraR/DksA C4-type zinc finger protein [Niabella sp.]|nr:TraR/DksA C4-type zinc finger protein [Niabella sp.]